MKSLSAIKLSGSERAALIELKKRLSEELPGLRVILYGSKARGDSIPESDIDLLVLVEEDVTPAMRKKIRSIKYAIELKYDVIISLLIETVNYWQSVQAQAMPLHWNIDREGVPL
jgi:predicted nucleotidyltransferase